MNWKMMTTIAAAALITGCSTASPAPFHMYSSPLLEGEMETPRSAAEAVFDDAGGAAPGVRSRQVYVYQRWTDEAAPAIPQRQIQTAGAPGQRPGYAPPLDTVQPSSEPVLANYAWDPDQPSGAGRATGDGGSAPGSELKPDDVVTALSDNSPSEEVEQAEQAEQVAVDQAVESTPSTTEDSAVQTVDYAPTAADYVYTTLRANDLDLGEGAKDNIPTLYRACRSQGQVYHTSRPDIGDVVFFHNTYDANNDGRNNNWYTLVGIVEKVHRDGTVEFLTHRGNGVETLRLNLDQLDRETGSGGQIINSKLRTPTTDDAPFTQYLSGQLFAGYCNVLGDRRDLVLISNWEPGMEF